MLHGLWVVVREVSSAVIPMVILVLLLHFTLLPLGTAMFVRFAAGAILVPLGLTFFLLGLRTGLLPVGESIGSELIQRRSVFLVLLTSFILGLVVTISEPDVRVLSRQVDLVSQGQISSGILVITVALGIAVFLSLSMLRSIARLSLKWLLGVGYSVILAMILITPPEYLAISFDAGGVTTGPMTVPFIIALGVGASRVFGRSSSSSSLSDGFGLVAIASMGPIIAVMILGLIYG